MKLRKVRIENFRAIKDTEIVFADALNTIRPVTVLAGPNGTGKTSVLFAIIQALRGVMGYRTSDVPEPDERDIHTHLPSEACRRRPHQFLSLSTSNLVTRRGLRSAKSWLK